jgi:IPT/TIG domain
MLLRKGTHRSTTVRTAVVVGLVALWLLPIRSAQAAVPSVTSFTPQSGTVGTAVTVTGTGFTGDQRAQCRKEVVPSGSLRA